MNKLDQFEALEKAATAGPWRHEGGRHWQPYQSHRVDRDCYVARTSEDAALIAAARNLAPAFIRLARVVAEVVERRHLDLSVRVELRDALAPLLTDSNETPAAGRVTDGA